MAHAKEKSNIVYIEPSKGRAVPDYIENREAAKELVDRLMDYYHRRGYTNVKIWLEPDTQASGRRFFYVRSNITFKVPQF